MLKRIFILLAVAGTYLALSAPAHAETVWRTWGACPFAETRKEAFGRLEKFLAHADMPEEVKNRFRARLVDPDNPGGTKRDINPGDRFQMMMSCGAEPMTDVLVGDYLDSNKVTHKGFKLAAIEWTEDFEGKRYTVTLPERCNNFALVVGTIPPPPREVIPESDCYELDVPTVHAGDRVILKVRHVRTGKIAPMPLCLSKNPAEWASLPNCTSCFKVNGPSKFPIPAYIAENKELETLVCWIHDGKEVLQGVVPSGAWVDRKFVVPDLETIAPIPKGGGN